MSQEDSDQAINDDPSIVENSNATGDGTGGQQKSAEELAAEAEAAAAEQARRILEKKISVVDDAEEVCVFLVEDTLDAMFQEMQVLAENASVFARTSEWASESVFVGVSMSATQASASLDRSDSVESSSFDGARQQVLKLDEDRCDDAGGIVHESPGRRPGVRPEATPEQSSSYLRLLRRLLAFLESSTDQVAREFMMFPPAQYVQRSIHARSTIAAVTSGSRPTGDWEIPSDSVRGCLAHLIDRCHVRVFPSTVSAVYEANSTTIDAKVRAKATLSLSQLTHFVRKAVLVAKQEAEAAMQETQQRQRHDTVDTARRTFQTELIDTNNSSGSSGREGSRSMLQSCFMEEALPAAPAIDRNVPGRIARKSVDPSEPPKNVDQRHLLRRVIMALMPGPKESSKWFGLRTRIVHDADPNVVQVTVDADMEVSTGTNSDSDDAGTVVPTKPTFSPKKPSVQFAAAARSPIVAPRSSKFVGRSFSTTSNNKEERAVGNSITIITAEPDAAALSNIFSLGTPRQLTGGELERRNDILAQLEREELQHQRRLANASIAAMTFPPTASPSDAEERAFRAYVAANSSITTGVGFNLKLPMASMASVDGTSPPPVAPRRPEKKNTSQSPHRRGRKASGVQGGRSKFEVALDPPAFAVHDGNDCADFFAKEAAGTGVPQYSSSQRVSQSKYAGPPSSFDVSAAAVAAGASALIGGSGLSPIRPVQSAGHHLPQLDTSRLAIGVRAVVRGVEKRGPRHNPSRQSRLKLHNYNTEVDSIGGDKGNDTFGAPSPPHREIQQPRDPRASVPHSPIRSSTLTGAPTSPSAVTTPSSGSTYLPLIPPVSPVTTGGVSPHRGKHVVFVDADGSPSKTRKRTGKEEDLTAVSPSKGSELRSPKRKNQLVFDKKTVSPPRVRNRHFTNTSKKLRTDYSSDYQGDSDDGSAGDFGGDRSPVKGGDSNLFEQPLKAPRRNLLPTHGY